MSLRESARPSVVALAGPLELIEDETGTLRGVWRGQSVEVDPRQGVARLRAGAFTGSVAFVERFGRAPELRAEQSDPELSEAVQDCVANCEPARSWLTRPGRRVRNGWVELPLGDDLETARARLDELVANASEWPKIYAEAEKLAADRSRLNARAEEARWIAERALAADRTIAAFARRKRIARFGPRLVGLGCVTWLVTGFIGFKLPAPSPLLNSLALTSLGVTALGWFCGWWLQRCPECGQPMRGIPDHQCPRCRTVLRLKPPSEG